MKAFLLFILAFALPCAAATLEWDANSETNIGGYKVYHSSLSRHTPGIVPFVPYVISTNSTTNITFTITNLVNGTNWFAVTAFDTDGLESDYSDEVFLVWTNRPAKVRGVRFAPTLNAQSAPTPTGPWSPEVQLAELELTANSRFYRLAIAVPDSSMLLVPKRLRHDGSKAGKLPLMIPKRPRTSLPFPG